MSRTENNEKCVNETIGTYESSCFICENTNGLKAFKGTFVCSDCISLAQSM